jgi:hypothetical protein
MSEELDAADILEKAADLIESVGHCKGTFFETRGAGYEISNAVSYCALGAMDAANNYNSYGIISFRRTDAHNEAIEALTIELCGESNDIYESANLIAQWNDNSERTPEQVVDLMKHVAKDLRNRGSDA